MHEMVEREGKATIIGLWVLLAREGNSAAEFPSFVKGYSSFKGTNGRW